MNSNAPDYLTSQEIQQLLNVIDDTRDRAIVILFLSTGIFLNEMAELTVEDIHWDDRTLKVQGKRQRELPITNECYDALARWSKERIDNPQTNAFFLRTKGKATGLTSRGIDELIRKYGKKSELTKSVNAHILRNTFAVRLINTQTPEDQRPKTDVAKLLGITDTESIARYKLTTNASDSQSPASSNEPNILTESSAVDTLINQVFPIQPKILKANQTPAERINPDTILIGRDHVIRDIKAELNKGQSILLTGPLGIGKSHMLKYLTQAQPDTMIYFPSPIPIRQLLLKLVSVSCRGAKEGDTLFTPQKEFSRLSIQDLLTKLIQEKPLTRPILAIDNLDRLKVTDTDIIQTLLKHFTILGATDDQPDRLKVIWWKFQEIELNPLSENHSKTLIQTLTQNLAISDYELLETHILKQANGLPLAIVDMANQLQTKNVVTSEVVRQLNHTAGLKFRSWEWLLGVIFSGMVLIRFVALGTHSFETYIMAGIGLSIFGGLRFVMKRYKS